MLAPLSNYWGGGGGLPPPCPPPSSYAYVTTVAEVSRSDIIMIDIQNHDKAQTHLKYLLNSEGREITERSSQLQQSWFKCCSLPFAF